MNEEEYISSLISKFESGSGYANQMEEGRIMRYLFEKLIKLQQEIKETKGWR